MTLVKWEPFRELMAMQDRMTRLFDETLIRMWKEEPIRGVWSPLVDIIERENELVLKIDLPEVDVNEIDIHVEDNTLIIQGERRFLKEAADEKYIQIERPYGTFRRIFALPRMIDHGNIKASCKDGVLKVSLHRRGGENPRRISVETKLNG